MVRGYTSNYHVATLTLYPQRSMLLRCNDDSFCRFRGLTYERVRSNNSLCVCVCVFSLDVTCAEHFARTVSRHTVTYIITIVFN